MSLNVDVVKSNDAMQIPFKLKSQLADVEEFTKLRIQENGSNHWQSPNKNLGELTLAEEKIDKDSRGYPVQRMRALGVSAFSPNSSKPVLISQGRVAEYVNPKMFFSGARTILS